MKRLLFPLFIFTTSIQAYCQDSIPIINEVICKSNPLDTLEFDQIFACTINYDSTNNRQTLTQMSYNVNNYDLSSKQASSKRNVDPSLFAEIITLFSDTSTYGENYADCFEPRFVLQFKQKDQEKFRIIICEGCGFLISTKPIPAAYSRFYDNPFEDEGKQVIYRRYLKGFSEDGARKINELCKALKMMYCAD